VTIDFWGLGLQAINVLVLVWLLSRVFWRPVAAAIARRQDNCRATMGAAEAVQVKANAAMAEIDRTRSGMTAERKAVIEAAKVEADAATKAALAKARTKADAMLANAKTTIDQNADAAHKANEALASDLSLKIAAKILHRLNGSAVQSDFLSLLITAIANIPAADRTAMVDDPKGIEIVTASDPGDAQQNIEKAVRTALGGSADLRFVTDPDLIAGLELRSAHFDLRNSWQADLTKIQKVVKDAA